MQGDGTLGCPGSFGKHCLSSIVSLEHDELSCLLDKRLRWLMGDCLMLPCLAASDSNRSLK